MPKVIELDFTGVEPAQGTPIVRIAPGTYQMAIKLDTADSSNGKPMVKATYTITKGPERGKKLFENFVMPRPGSDDGKYGQQRFHALLIAAGAKKLTSKVKIDLEKFDNRELLGEVNDETREASSDGKYPERIQSRVFAVFPLPKAGANGAAQPTAQAEAPGEDDTPTVETAPVAVAAPEEASVPQEALANVDDLFLEN